MAAPSTHVGQSRPRVRSSERDPLRPCKNKEKDMPVDNTVATATDQPIHNVGRAWKGNTDEETVQRHIMSVRAFRELSVGDEVVLHGLLPDEGDGQRGVIVDVAIKPVGPRSARLHATHFVVDVGGDKALRVHAAHVAEAVKQS